MKIDHKESLEDFGNQFAIDKKIDNYWGSNELLKDIVYPFKLDSIKNKIIAEVGVGSGRIIKQLLSFLPQKIYAIEPSKAIEIAKKNNKDYLNKLEFLNIRGQNITFDSELDFIFSIGVIHHIPQADEVCKKIYKSLKPGGKFIVWLYGKEGNELYLLIFNNLRRITRILPDIILRFLSSILNIFASFYLFLCKFLNLPLKNYFLNVFGKCSFEKRRYIIFDQLNPSYAKYYSKNDVEDLLRNSGFSNFEIHNRHNYSWTAVAIKK